MNLFSFYIDRCITKSFIKELHFRGQGLAISLLIFSNFNGGVKSFPFEIFETNDAIEPLTFLDYPDHKNQLQ